MACRYLAGLLDAIGCIYINEDRGYWKLAWRLKSTDAGLINELARTTVRGVHIFRPRALARGWRIDVHDKYELTCLFTYGYRECAVKKNIFCAALNLAGIMHKSDNCRVGTNDELDSFAMQLRHMIAESRKCSGNLEDYCDRKLAKVRSPLPLHLENGAAVPDDSAAATG